ncbi:MAG: 30S ribosomal protein S17 [Candidatus Geothermincolia bacterium]
MTRKTTRKVRVGKVIGDRPDKTITVLIETIYRHPIYKKTLRKTKNFAVHDEGNTAHVGDIVKIMETRPYSKTKHWRLVEIVKEAE